MMKSARGDPAVQKLLDERQRIETWLVRLSSAETAPARVRSRVREDYERRLGQIIQELKRHVQALREGLIDREAVRRRLGEDAVHLEDRMAEARLRHEVGEYNEEEWERVETDGEAELAAVRARLATVQEEIEKLSEVVRIIEASERRPQEAPPSLEPPVVRPHHEPTVSVPRAAPPPPPAPPAAHPAPLAAPVGSAGTNAGPPSRAPEAAAPPRPPQPPPRAPQPVSEPKATTRPVEPPRPAPPTVRPPPRPSGQVQTEAFDELAFLKSVTEDTEAPQPRRASGSQSAPALVRDDGAPPAARPTSPFRRPAAGQAEKTLKCAECGTMNLPTEWYCEQCGAELAAL